MTKISGDFFLEMIWREAIRYVNVPKPKGDTVREKTDHLIQEIQNAISELEEKHKRKTHAMVTLQTLLTVLAHFFNSIDE